MATARGPFCAEVGCEKPEPGIFQVALASLGVAPGDALHVGDDR